MKESRWDPQRQPGGEETGEPRLARLLWFLQEGTGEAGQAGRLRLTGRFKPVSILGDTGCFLLPGKWVWGNLGK